MPRPGDALIAVGLFVIAIMGHFTLRHESAAYPDSSTPLAVALISLMTLPLAWRHRAPRSILWLSIVAWMIFVALGNPNAASILGLVVALYGVGLYLPRKDALINGIGGMLTVVGWTTVGVFTSDEVDIAAVVSTIIALVVALGIGLADSRRQARFTELEIAHARQEQARKSAAADAVRAERARIAGELHDVVAHEVTVMTLQAEGAQRLAKNSDPRVAAALQTISESGRKGLMEMQRMIGVLRASEADAAEGAGMDDGSYASSGHEVLDLMPMPSLAALPELVQQVADSGLPVSLEVSGSAHVPAGVELSAFRIVQESLTNAMKHAGPGATAIVVVNRESTAVTITVEDDGRGVISEAMHSGGHGIGGMKERISRLGGTIDIGPRQGGGYRVHAVLPSGDDQVMSARPTAPAKDTNQGDHA
jgi:signal transduction histidine kinase